MKGKDMHWVTFYQDKKWQQQSSWDYPYYYNIEKYLVLTRSQAKSSGIKLPEVHSMGKNLDPNMKPEKQHANSKKGSVENPYIGQGRGGSRRKRPDPIDQTINKPSELSEKNPRRTKLETGKTNLVHSQRSNTFNKQCEWRMTDYKSFNPRCSLPSRSSI